MNCAVYSCQLVRSATVKYEAVSLKTPEAAGELICRLTRGIMENAPQEVMAVICVDVKHKPIGIHEITRGTLSSNLVHPREVLKPCLLNNAHAFFLVHNHPSGDLTPSSQDFDVTRRISEAADILGIPCLDHFVVGMKESGVWGFQSIRSLI